MKITGLRLLCRDLRSARSQHCNHSSWCWVCIRLVQIMTLVFIVNIFSDSYHIINTHAHTLKESDPPELRRGDEGDLLHVIHKCSIICWFVNVESFISCWFLFVILLRYYELGPDDPPYAAKFYDCCGAENPEASGCTTGFHISYDDSWSGNVCPSSNTSYSICSMKKTSFSFRKLNTFSTSHLFYNFDKIYTNSIQFLHYL